MQTKMIRGMLVKDKEWSWFSKKDNHIRKEDEEVYNFLNKYKN